MTTTSENWYSSWFDTDYYHILYKDRGYEEAELFMKNLTTFLKLKKGSSILDLACGKGRHSIYLNKLGYDVTGVDLSPNSIEHAKKFENKNLHFQVHNMCEPMGQKFDAVFNLFTSFGYFENESDNLSTIKAIKENLTADGAGVIDFLNVEKTLKNLVPSEVKTIKNIDFHIKRFIENGFIIKEISFEDKGESFHFVERVKALTPNDFKEYFKEAGLTMTNCFGDYNLNRFQAKDSERLIMVFQ
ncbi:MAG TPA: class I SAM-dependent methyltransferase [Salinimicrobium sp.]|nr:class I SAM-dependent methyltransferase [Salinimicrobium sp.]